MSALAAFLKPTVTTLEKEVVISDRFVGEDIQVTGQNTGNSNFDRQALGNAIRDIIIEQSAASSLRSTARAV